MQGVEAFRSGLRGRWLRRGGQWNEEVLEPQMVKDFSDVTPLAQICTASTRLCVLAEFARGGL